MRGRTLGLGLLILFLCACSDHPWNDPHPASDGGRAVLYESFAERPKHLDPVSSYSEDEARFISQIYEPPLQYHLLKRPYELVPLTATSLPTLTYLDATGAVLTGDPPAGAVVRSIYRIDLKPGILYQPHPAFARDAQGRLLYHELTPEEIARTRSLSDFPHTGTRALHADDYVYQIKRMAHPRLHSPLSGLMGQYIPGLQELAAQLTGEAGAYIDLRRYDIEGVRAIDSDTFEIEIRGKYPQFVYWLAMNFFAPIPWEADAFYAQPGLADRNITLDWWPVGTGPYMLTENDPNRRMVLERNPNFRGETYPSEGSAEHRAAGLLEDAGRPMPFIDVAWYSLEREAIPVWNKFLQGWYDRSGITSDSFDQAITFGADGEAQLSAIMQAQGIRLATAVEPSIAYMGFNMRDPVVGGASERARLLRRALSIAVDYEEYISIFRNGRGIAAQGPIPPGIHGYHEGSSGINPYVYEWRDGRMQRKDIQEARRLLERAGYPGGRDAVTGRPLVLHLDTPAAGPGSKAGFDWLVKQFGRLGIQLVIRATDYNRFQDKVRNGTTQIYQWGWNADYPDPENFMFLLYGPNSKVERGGENASNYANPEFDALFLRTKDMANGPERDALLDRMIEIVRRDAPWIWGFHPVAYSLSHSWYGNGVPNLMAKNTLKYRKIDAAAREVQRRAWNEPVLWPVALAAVLLTGAVIPAVVVYRRLLRSPAL